MISTLRVDPTHTQLNKNTQGMKYIYFFLQFKRAADHEGGSQALNRCGRTGDLGVHHRLFWAIGHMPDAAFAVSHTWQGEDS